MRFWKVLILRALAATLLAQASLAAALEPAGLHTAVDQYFAGRGGPMAARCTDAEFLRRASLHLTGRPPSADETRAFLADSSPDKRARQIARLLDSPHYARHMSVVFDVMLMERRAYQNVTQDEWQKYLLESFRQNKPWNVLVREILSADGDEPALRAAARFALDRGSEPNLLTRDIGRIFFGRDMQCAQCHDHPLIDDYRQADYHGLLAFVAPGYALVRKEGNKQVAIYAEKAGGDVPFESVFFKGTRHLTGPRLPDDVEVAEPFFYPGEEYQVAPAENVKPVPKFSRRAKLAELAASGGNRAFNENIANRLWAHLMGRGLVHPPDLHHSANPPSDPALLKLLGESIAAMNFDIRAFLRELALTEVYQRSLDGPADLLALSVQAAPAVTALDQQRAVLESQAAASAAAFQAAFAQWEQAEAALLPSHAGLETARNQLAEARKKYDPAQQALATAQAQLQAKQDLATAVQQAAAAAEKAAAMLAENQQVASAYRTLAERAAQLAAQLPSFQQAVAEKQTVLKPLEEALAAARSAVDTAAARTAPLRDSLRQQEQALLAARRQMTADTAALNSLRKRLETTQRLARLSEWHQAVPAAAQAVAARAAERDAAKTQLADYASVVAERESAVKTAAEAHARATAALDSAKAEHARRLELAGSLASAFQAAEAARQQLPDDAPLAQAAATLKERAAQLQAQTAEAETALNAATAAARTAAERVESARAALTEAAAERTRREQVLAAAQAALAAAEHDLPARQQAYDDAVAELYERWTSEFAVAPLQPLSPEQLCWSILTVTGVYGRQWAAEQAELDKSAPLTDEQRQDPAQMAARLRDIEQRTFDKLKGNVSTFVAYYGAGAGQPQGDFFATADQALFAANAGAINGWVAPVSGNVTERIVSAADPRAAAEELYLTVLTRLPTDAEVADVTAYLAARAADKPVAAQELVWSLLNSVEFRFNH